MTASIVTTSFMGNAMQLQLATWQEVERYLASSTGIIMPIGSAEQHGPNGLIGTDAVCPEIIARGLGLATDAMVAPTISVGIAQHHLGFAGSMCLRPSTMIQLIRDYVVSLARHGFDRFFFLNGHGGNIATVEAAFAEIHSEVSMLTREAKRPLRCTLSNWWDSKGVKAISRELYGDDEGQHATCSEVSVTQYAYPEAIKNANFEGRAAAYSGIHDADDYRRRYPDGRIGSLPSLSTPEAGKQLYEASIADLGETYRDFLSSA
jgi:creatinine amidohydrolase